MSSSPTPFLVWLANRLTNGLVFLDEDRRGRHRDFVLAHQTEDGGFRGREGDSDLYYTSFAARSLMMLGALDRKTSVRVGEYLGRHDWRTLNVIDLMNWLATGLAVQLTSGVDILADEPDGWADEIAAKLEGVRTADGGYAKSPKGASGSMYHSFLVLLTYQLLFRNPPRTNALIQFVYDRQRDDGGFVEISPMKRSGTNPTAAAATILAELDSVDEEIRSDITGFYRDVLSDEGGFQANSRVPFADSLSTFTVVLTTEHLRLPRTFQPDRILPWLTTQLEFPTGGFRAATWDENADVEYTFYGLGLLSLLSQEIRTAPS
ncbi:MAG: terpene cyclase/mutase family protein [Planctomycetaceae bacterium]|nr:terpene cyclase/mutase family protein [Planctomycetaceae bacterium]